MLIFFYVSNFICHMALTCQYSKTNPSIFPHSFKVKSVFSYMYMIIVSHISNMLYFNTN